MENDLETEKENIESQIKYLENKGIVYKSSASYKDGEAYDLKIMTNALDPSFNYCAFDEYNDNDLTEKYCDIKEELNDIKNANLDFDKRFNSFSSIPFFMFGGFVIISSLMISAFIYTIAKRREILAFTAQQTMPIAKEGMEKMAPTIGKVGKTIVKDMAPAYGEIAKEISKGIKDGLKENKDTKKREK